MRKTHGYLLRKSTWLKERRKFVLLVFYDPASKSCKYIHPTLNQSKTDKMRLFYYQETIAVLLKSPFCWIQINVLRMTHLYSNIGKYHIMGPFQLQQGKHGPTNVFTQIHSLVFIVPLLFTFSPPLLFPVRYLIHSTIILRHTAFSFTIWNTDKIPPSSLSQSSCFKAQNA